MLWQTPRTKRQEPNKLKEKEIKKVSAVVGGDSSHEGCEKNRN
jgi:hypothetical protein